MIDEYEYITVKDNKPCINCGKPTDRIEINYMGRICSEKCCKEVDEGFVKALKGDYSDGSKNYSTESK